jgi:hypothetical protein
MSLTLEERLSIEADIEWLYEAVPSHAILDRDQARKYIDVGEYGLALDDLAAIYLESKSPVRPEILALFEKLAIKMEMQSGDEWRAVADILSTR